MYIMSFRFIANRLYKYKKIESISEILSVQNEDNIRESLQMVESHIGKVVLKFTFNSLIVLIIDDNKLRHSSKKFRETGLQISGFRSSRII